MNKLQKLEKQISKYYIKWSNGNLNVYEKIALKHLESEYKLLKSKDINL